MKENFLKKFTTQESIPPLPKVHSDISGGDNEITSCQKKEIKMKPLSKNEFFVDGKKINFYFK